MRKVRLWFCVPEFGMAGVPALVIRVNTLVSQGVVVKAKLVIRDLAPEKRWAGNLMSLYVWTRGDAIVPDESSCCGLMGPGMAGSI